MKKKYGALRTIGTIYKILGIVMAIISVIGAVGVCVFGFAGGALLDSASAMLGESTGASGTAGAGIAGVLLAIWSLVVGAIASVSTYAVGEGVYLLLDLEENTRRTAEQLENRA